MLICALILGSALLGATAAFAQGGSVCRGDAAKLCPEGFAARNREAAKICLMKQMDKVSPPCLAKLQEAEAR